MGKGVLLNNKHTSHSSRHQNNSIAQHFNTRTVTQFTNTITLNNSIRAAREQVQAASLRAELERPMHMRVLVCVCCVAVCDSRAQCRSEVIMVSSACLRRCEFALTRGGSLQCWRRVRLGLGWRPPQNILRQQQQKRVCQCE